MLQKLEINAKIPKLAPLEQIQNPCLQITPLMIANSQPFEALMGRFTVVELRICRKK